MKTKHYLLILAALLLIALVWHNTRKSVWVRRIQQKYPDGDAKTWSTTDVPWTLTQLFGLYVNGHPALEPKPEAEPTSEPNDWGDLTDTNFG